MDFPTTFPSLPGPGPPNHSTNQAHQLISQSYCSSLHLLRQEEGDPIRLRFHIDRLKERILPLFMAFSSREIPGEWLINGVHILGQLLVALEKAAQGSEEE